MVLCQNTPDDRGQKTGDAMNSRQRPDEGGIAAVAESWMDFASHGRCHMIQPVPAFRPADHARAFLIAAGCAPPCFEEISGHPRARKFLEKTIATAERNAGIVPKGNAGSLHQRLKKIVRQEWPRAEDVVFVAQKISASLQNGDDAAFNRTLSAYGPEHAAEAFFLVSHASPDLFRKIHRHPAGMNFLDIVIRHVEFSLGWFPRKTPGSPARRLDTVMAGAWSSPKPGGP
ncbi:MAG: hypothetical protein M3O22_01530 [Pseudomonadota bacterium]|nr:hypothetical protein [Pseudomonadota bacterium]